VFTGQRDSQGATTRRQWAAHDHQRSKDVRTKRSPDEDERDNDCLATDKVLRLAEFVSTSAVIDVWDNYHAVLFAVLLDAHS
jgi:hypothetical protein